MRGMTDEGLEFIVLSMVGASVWLRAFGTQNDSRDRFVRFANWTSPLTRPPFGGHPLPSGRGTIY